ncbi:MAG TPA: alpha/beta fold hydrolase [Steroidobacteraceae bacterium]|jgi:4,5:9,10-diseco-3-hydroxy-5,9,17-trioxoandrosta-1(10),2-diene-4-oate hydrolase|nr:alpha/beta fold hydrolase [Steroidobacteraceae bacterium]
MSNTSKIANVNGKPIHYLDVGEGEPVVLVHGGGPGASGGSNYSRNIDALSARYRVIVPDLPGYGRSDKGKISGPRYAAYSAALVGLLDVLGIPRAHFVGNSLGGGASIKTALEAPERIGKLVLMGPAGLVSAYTRVPTEGARLIFQYYGGDGPSREKLKAFLDIMIYDPSNLTPQLIEERYQASVTPELLANPPLGRGEVPVLEELWRDPRLATLPHDTLILWGREDRVNPPYTADILMSQIPNAQLVTFTRCGHWVQWEKADAFNTIVSAFLAGYRAN